MSSEFVVNNWRFIYWVVSISFCIVHSSGIYGLLGAGTLCCLVVRAVHNSLYLLGCLLCPGESHAVYNVMMMMIKLLLFH
jgi:hypothetical protein